MLSELVILSELLTPVSWTRPARWSGASLSAVSVNSGTVMPTLDLERARSD